MTSLIEVAVRSLKTSRTPQTMIAALLAWAITVAPSAYSRSAPATARVCAVLALLCGLLGPLFLGERRRIGRHLGITAFLALCVGAWLLSSHALHPLRLSPFRGATGSVAWAIFALSWREVWPKPNPSAQDAQAALLAPRSSLPRLSVPILTVSLLGALFFVLVAFWTRDVERGMVAQAIAVTAGVALVTVAAVVATTIGKDRNTSLSGRRFTGVVIRSLVLLVVVAICGALYILLRT